MKHILWQTASHFIGRLKRCEFFGRKPRSCIWHVVVKCGSNTTLCGKTISDSRGLVDTEGPKDPGHPLCGACYDVLARRRAQ